MQFLITEPAAAPDRRTLERAIRETHYFAAHRGSGDVYPEHSLPAYQAALEAGAMCMEVSVCMTSDGVLICMHDLAYDRTTTGHGVIADQPASVLNSIWIRQPQLGPYWLKPPYTRVPRLDEVLHKFGARMVICLEAKDDRAYGPMMAMVDKLGLRDSVIVKTFWTSKRIAQAKAAGFPVFVYVGTQQMDESAIATVARRLDPQRDCLVLPATPGDDITYYPDELIRKAVASGVPVWMYPVHRRIDADHYFDLGAAGAMSSSYAHTSSNHAITTRDRWSQKRVLPGEMSRHPENDRVAPAWTGSDQLKLGVHGMQQFVTLGEFAPIAAAAGSYQITFDACWLTLPVDLSTNLTLAFGHSDDSYYGHRLGRSNGYHGSRGQMVGCSCIGTRPGSVMEPCWAERFTQAPKVSQPERAGA